MDSIPTECKHCGSDTFYRNVRFSGSSIYYATFDPERHGDNSGILEDAIIYNHGKRIYCANCDKYLGAFDRLELELRNE